MMRFNKNKKIGNVLFIVEGSKTEFYILKKIFAGILDYSYEEIKRNNNFKYKNYVSKRYRHSRVFVINAEESNLRHIADENKFMDDLIVRLINDYDFPVDRASVYYVFERDNLSNDQKVCENMIGIYKNTLDNGISRRGLLLLSYPSIEAFVSLCFSKKHECKTGRELKQFNNVSGINQQKIDEEKIVSATNMMISILKDDFSIDFDIDRVGDINLQLYKAQENSFNTIEKLVVLSLLSIAFIDLGIIEDG